METQSDRPIPEGSVIPVAWGALALACVCALMSARFAARGNGEFAALAYGSWPYLIYVLLVISLINVFADLAWRLKHLIRFIQAQRSLARTRVEEAEEIASRIPGADPERVKRMLKSGDL